MSSTSTLVPACDVWQVDEPPRRFVRVETVQQDGAWLDYVIDALSDLLVLQPGWDSYGAKAIDHNAAYVVVDVLDQIMHSTTPLPALVPLRSGGIQIEWHERGVDLEIQVRSQMDVSAYYADDAGDEWEKVLGANFSALRAPMRKLSGL
jgi:hypothetical protein